MKLFYRRSILFLALSFTLAHASTITPSSRNQDLLDKIGSTGNEEQYLSGLPIRSEPYAFSLLDDAEISDSWLSKIQTQLIHELDRTTWGSDDLWLKISLSSGYEWLRSEPVTLLGVQAVANPLISSRDAMFTGDGHHGWIGTQITSQLSPFLSVQASPYFRLSSHDDLFNDHASFYLREALASFHLKRAVVEAGRDTTQWGNGRIGHLLFSRDHEPLNQIRIRSDEPIVGPSFLEALGPTQFEMFFSVLDKKQLFPHTRLFGTYFSFHPTKRFEFGLGETVLFGGTGAPANNPLVIFSEQASDSSNPANRNFIFSSRFRIPTLEIEPYLELMWEDCCGTPPINPRDMMDLFGIYFPRVDPMGKLDFTVESVRTTHITYRHVPYKSGYTYKNRILGHPLGPDAFGLYNQLRYFYSEKIQSKLLYAFEIRGREATDYANIDETISVPGFQSNEQRHRVTLEFQISLPEGWLLSTRTGLERVNHENYQLTTGKWNGLFGLELTYPL